MEAEELRYSINQMYVIYSTHQWSFYDSKDLS